MQDYFTLYQVIYFLLDVPKELTQSIIIAILILIILEKIKDKI